MFEVFEYARKVSSVDSQVQSITDDCLSCLRIWRFPYACILRRNLTVFRYEPVYCCHFDVVITPVCSNFWYISKTVHHQS